MSLVCGTLLWQLWETEMGVSTLGQVKQVGEVYLAVGMVSAPSRLGGKKYHIYKCV